MSLENFIWGTVKTARNCLILLGVSFLLENGYMIYDKLNDKESKVNSVYEGMSLSLSNNPTYPILPHISKDLDSTSPSLKELLDMINEREKRNLIYRGEKPSLSTNLYNKA